MGVPHVVKLWHPYDARLYVRCGWDLFAVGRAPSNASSLVVWRTTGRDFATAMCDIARTLSSSERWLIITPCGKNQCSEGGSNYGCCVGNTHLRVSSRARGVLNEGNILRDGRAIGEVARCGAVERVGR